MNREDGFPIADIDIGFYSDPKVTALVRRLRDPVRTMVDLGHYQALVYASWGAGDRLTLEESAPPWWFDPLDETAADLEAVGLIDEEHRVPETAWTNNFVPAFNRREKRRSSGAEGGKRSWESRRDKRRRSDGSAAPNPSVSPSDRPAGLQAEPAGLSVGAEATNGADRPDPYGAGPAPIWPDGGPRPESIEEAEANLARAKRQWSTNDWRFKTAKNRANDLRREQPGVHSVGDMTAIGDVAADQATEEKP